MNSSKINFRRNSRNTHWSIWREKLWKTIYKIIFGISWTASGEIAGAFLGTQDLSYCPQQNDTHNYYTRFSYFFSEILLVSCREFIVRFPEELPLWFPLLTFLHKIFTEFLLDFLADFFPLWDCFSQRTSRVISNISSRDFSQKHSWITFRISRGFFCRSFFCRVYHRSFETSPGVSFWISLEVSAGFCPKDVLTL